MSETIQSEGSKLNEISGLLSGSRDVPAVVNGESVHNPVSPRAPTTGQYEGREVGQVRKPKPVDITRISLDDLKHSDLSSLAKQVAGVRPINDPPVEMVQQYQQIQQAAANIQARFNSVDWDALAQVDPGRAVYAQMELAHELGNLREARQWAAQFEAEYQKAIAHNQNLFFAHALLEAMPWVASAKHFAEAVKWAKQEYGITDQDIATVSNEQFWQGCAEYQAYAEKRGKKLTRDLSTKVAGEAISAIARRERQKTGRLSVERQGQLVSALLSGKV